MIDDPTGNAMFLILCVLVVASGLIWLWLLLHLACCKWREHFICDRVRRMFRFLRGEP